MANDNNLIPLDKRDPETAKQIRSKGGKASAKAKKHKKAMNEVAKLFLNMDLSPKMQAQVIKQYGDIEEEAISNRFPLVANLYAIALDTQKYTPSERIAAMKFLLELAGESPNQIAMKEMEKSKQAQVEDDPFSASLKSMFGGGGE